MFYEVTVRPWIWLQVDGVIEAAASRHVKKSVKELQIMDLWLFYQIVYNYLLKTNNLAPL